MSNQSDATDDTQDIADSLPGNNEEKSTNTAFERYKDMDSHE